MQKIKEVHKSTADADYTDMTNAVPTGERLELTARARGLRIQVLAVDADGVQISQSGITYSYQLFQIWQEGGNERRGWSPVVAGRSAGLIYDDEPPNKGGGGGTPRSIAVRITSKSGAGSADHLDVNMEEI